MANRRTRRTAALYRRRPTLLERITLSHTIGEMRAARTWFRPPTRPLAMAPAVPAIHQHEAWQIQDGANGPYCAACGESLPVNAEHWADTLLHCPPAHANRRTVRFAGKPYHWRQDYTGQLKLAVGESPW
jgi:hypothetical protein